MADCSDGTVATAALIGFGGAYWTTSPVQWMNPGFYSRYVGAFAVFVLGFARRWWRNEREQRGLLLAEIEPSAEVVGIIRGRDRP